MKTTIYRVELDHQDDFVAQIRWYADKADAQRLVDETAAEYHYDPEGDGRPEVLATVWEIEVDLTQDGIIQLLRDWAATAEPV